MNTLEDVYKQLCTEQVDERFELSISDDKTFLTLKLSDKLEVTADDDMIVVAKRKSLMGIPYDTLKHTHYADFDDLYQQLLTYMPADSI